MAAPIRGQTRPIPIKAGLMETQKLNANINASIHNRFDVEVIDTRTGEVRQKAQAENVICNALWTRLLTPANYFNCIHYGTGNGTPAVTDTSLFTFLGYGSPAYTDDVIDVQAENGWASFRRKIQLSETTAVGSTLTEVGIGYSTTAATLVTHAMLKDMNGNAISIAKTSTDIINIYATVFVHWVATGYDGGAIKIVPYLAKHAVSSSPLLGFLGMLMGVYASAYSTCTVPNYIQVLNSCSKASFTQRVPSALAAAYSIANKTITLTATRLAASANNDGGFFGILCYAYDSDARTYCPTLYLKVGGSWYPSTAITGEAIGTGDGTTKDFATAFPCPSNAKIYVDGIEQASGVTVGQEPLLYNDMGQYFDGLHEDSAPANLIPYPNPTLSSIRYSYIGFGPAVYYNPYYSVGIASIYAYKCKVEASNDLTVWTQVAAQEAETTVSVSAEYQNYKYWRFSSASGNADVYAFTAPSTYVGKPVHFDTAPASGAVITADYHTPVIAKDVNHVFDLTVTIQLGEYTA